ncbi:MAG: LysM peptidoglycan-binding domain-containing protein [Candidatus Bipolaricaulia bacterium]
MSEQRAALILSIISLALIVVMLFLVWDVGSELDGTQEEISVVTGRIGFLEQVQENQIEGIRTEFANLGEMQRRQADLIEGIRTEFANLGEMQRIQADLIEAIRTEFSNLKDVDRSLRGSVDRLQNEMASNRQEMVSLMRAEFESLLVAERQITRQELGQLQEQMTSLHDAFGSIGTQVDSLESTLAGEVDNLEAQVTELSDHMVTQAELEDALSLESASLSNQLVGLLEAQATELSDRMVTQAELEDALSLEVTSLSDQLVGLLEARVTGLGEVVTRVELEDALSLETASLSDQLVGLSEGIAGIERSIETRVDSLESALTGEVDNLEAQATRLSDHMVTRAELEDIISLESALANRVVGLSEEIGRVEQAIGTLTETVTGIEHEVSSSASRTASAAGPELEMAYFRYTVKRGDSLWAIATEVYGEPVLWTIIFYLNRDIIRNPDFVREGVTLTLPIVSGLGRILQTAP